LRPGGERGGRERERKGRITRMNARHLDCVMYGHEGAGWAHVGPEQRNGNKRVGEAKAVDLGQVRGANDLHLHAIGHGR